MRFLVATLFLLLLTSATAAEPVPTVVKFVSINAGIREDYYVDIIEAALKATEATHGPYKIEFTQDSVVVMRKQGFLIAGEQVNIDRMVETPANLAFRSNLIRVNYPLLRGFNCYRILLIRQDQQPDFDKVNTLKDLRKFTMGFGKGWEGFIYTQNGFKVSEPIGFELLLKMLAGKRFDFIPLNATEISDNYAVDGKPLPVAPENTLLLFTPLPMYFFVSPKVPELARRLEIGLRKIDEDGTAKKLFDHYFENHLKHLNLAKRKLIVLPTDATDEELGIVKDEWKKY